MLIVKYLQSPQMKYLLPIIEQNMIIPGDVAIVKEN
jgi:hypothetical protein